LLPGLAEARPGDLAAGYAAQEALIAALGERRIGWKIAATSAAGQRHIGVDGPLAGPILEGCTGRSGAEMPFNRHMKVAEAEFAFVLGRDLPDRGRPYGMEEVVAAVAAMHPAIELPDSRFADFASVGGPSLVADLACAWRFVLGPEAADWRGADLAAHPVAAFRNGALAAEGSGANVLGDPRLALTWLANDRIRFGGMLRAGEIVTTGTCVVPLALAAGDRVLADFGRFGTVEAAVAGA
jgi:2-keto-4-pentenoate hydratase